MSGKIKPYSKAPYDEVVSVNHRQWMEWVTSELNSLRGNAMVQPGQGFPALNPPLVEPTTGQIKTGGVRTGSVTTPLAFTSTPTAISFYWDGTNGSVPFQVYRDDASFTPPNKVGSPLVVTGLVAATLYFFYFYYDEDLGLVKPALIPGVAIGTPPMAFTVANIHAVQQQILRNRIPLAPAFSSAGITTPASGSGGGSGGSGGGSGGGRFNGL
jgi:hypothetical protein